MVIHSPVILIDSDKEVNQISCPLMLILAQRLKEFIGPTPRGEFNKYFHLD
jgi:hypothetical protein